MENRQFNWTILSVPHSSTKKVSYRGWEMAGGLGLRRGHVGQVLDHLLGVLGLSCSGLPSTQDALVLTV